MISGLAGEAVSVGLLLPLLSDGDTTGFWRTPDGDEAAVSDRLIESPLPPWGDAGFEAAATELGRSTSANGPPGANPAQEAGVSQVES